MRLLFGNNYLRLCGIVVPPMAAQGCVFEMPNAIRIASRAVARNFGKHLPIKSDRVKARPENLL